MRLHLLLLSILALVGCDDMILFDRLPDGRLLVAVDVEGRVSALGDASLPRYLAAVDVAGDVELWGEGPAPISWLRACGHAAVYVVGGRQLIHHVAHEPPRVLLETRQRLFQPLASEDGQRVAVLEGVEPGLPGTLHVLKVSSGELITSIPHALLGGAWDGDGLLVPLASTQRERAFEVGPGRIVRLRQGGRESLFEGPITPTLMTCSAGQAVFSAPMTSPDGGTQLGLCRIDTGGTQQGRPQGVFDLWPDLDDRGRLLFTRSERGKTLAGELRLSVAGSSRSRPLPTLGPVKAPRWLGTDMIAFVSGEDHLVVQDLDGNWRRDLTHALRMAVEQKEIR